MKVFAEKVVKHKKLIAILSLVLLIPCIFGYLNTRINYDMLTYLPDDIQTVQGQKILLDDFNKGSFALLIFEDMDDKDVSAAREKIEDLEKEIRFQMEDEVRQARDLEGKIFVITGDVHLYKNRKELQEVIESYGGKVASAVSKNTSYLINNDSLSSSTKNKKARELGIPILTEEEFKALL